MAKQVLYIYERLDGRELTDSMLEEAAKLFNGNYGVWGEDPTDLGSTSKAGKLDMTCSDLGH